ncbi:hypothetical protein [Streptomyces sp. bgisy153]|uniref:hypothetical protein n=1 Tax=Streptomyces sp. bgisy153 TaxID=3413793 RepID=UPI003D70CED8
MTSGPAGGNGTHRTTAALLDGSLIRTRRLRGTANRKNSSGSRTCHRLLLVSFADDEGRLIWVCATRPGRTSEVTASGHGTLTSLS